MRLVPTKGVGFAEFEDEVRATAALECNLKGFLVNLTLLVINGKALSDGTQLLINYAKR